MRRIRELTRNFATINWAIADQAIVSGTNFATTVLVARYLGLEEFGRFALAWLAIFFAQSAQIAMVVMPMMTIGAKQAARNRAVYAGAVAVQQTLLALLLVAFVAAGLFAVETVRPDWELGMLLVPVCMLVLAGQGCDFLRRYFYTYDKPVLSFVTDAIRYGSQLIGLLALFMISGSQVTISNVFYTLSLAAFLGVAFGCFYAGPFQFNSVWMAKIASRHWKFARWLMPSAISTWCRENFVHTAVAAILGLGELGALRAAQQLVRMVNVLIQAFDNIVPMRAGMAFSDQGFAGLVDFTERFMLRYNAGIAGLLLIIALLGSPLMSLVYGAGYANYGMLVAAYSAVMVLYLIRNLLAIMLRAMETTVFEFYSSVTAALFISLASAPLIAQFGMAGAFIALAAFECLMILCLSFGVHRQHATSMSGGQS